MINPKREDVSERRLKAKLRKQKQRALIRQDPDKLAEYHLKDRERKALERRMGKNQESDEQRERRRKRDREAKAKDGYQQEGLYH